MRKNFGWPYKSTITHRTNHQTLVSPSAFKATLNGNPKMHSFAVLFALVAVAQTAFIPATTFLRAPAHDSAIIRSDRLGGNFAYSVQESHAFAAVSPVVTNVRTPVAVSYSVPAPIAHYAAHVPVALAQPAVHVKEVQIPQVEVKTVELPKFEVPLAAALPYHHAVPVTAYSGLPLAYHGLPVAHAGAPFSFVEVKATEEKKAE